jgi:hypothetical protein
MERSGIARNAREFRPQRPIPARSVASERPPAGTGTARGLFSTAKRFERSAARRGGAPDGRQPVQDRATAGGRSVSFG